MIFNHFSQTTRNTERENVLSTGRKQYNKLSVFLLHFATMWLAVFADVGVTVLAVLNAMRALRASSACHLD
jgi:Cd2+/Zn2+-exporting ATPase